MATYGDLTNPSGIDWKYHHRVKRVKKHTYTWEYRLSISIANESLIFRKGFDRVEIFSAKWTADFLTNASCRFIYGWIAIVYIVKFWVICNCWPEVSASVFRHRNHFPINLLEIICRNHLFTTWKLTNGVSQFNVFCLCVRYTGLNALNSCTYAFFSTRESLAHKFLVKKKENWKNS